MSPSIRRKLDALAERHEEVGLLLAAPEVAADNKRFRELSREYAQLEPLTRALREYDGANAELEAARALLADPDMRDMAEEEVERLEARLAELDTELGLLLLPRDPRALNKAWKPQDDFIIEWRALTVALLDEVAVLVRERLGKTAEALPLACVLEGGTWAAGREIAKELRPDGAPPLKIESDGTIF